MAPRTFGVKGAIPGCMNWKCVLGKLRAFGLGLSVSILLTGCFETTQEYTINPDGSGKLVHECIFQEMNLNLTADKPDATDALRNAVRNLLKESKGVEVWRDVTFRTLDDGRMYFHGTAYFKDLSKVEIPNQTMLNFVWAREPGGSLSLSLRTNASFSQRGFTFHTEKSSGAKLSPEERTKQIKEQRANYQQAKPMLTAILGSMKQLTVLRLPGNLGQSSNFERLPSGALKIGFDGAKLLEAMNKLAEDNTWWQKENGFAEMTGSPPLPDEVNEMLFGKKAPVRAVMNNANAPLFNYAPEVVAAKAEFAKLEKELGLSAAALAPPACGEPLKNLRVTGVRLITESDSKRDLRPFNYEAGYTLSLAGEFAGSVLAVIDRSAVDTAVDSNGNSLLPTSQWERALHFPRLSKDKTAVIFEVQLKLPEKGVSGLKELSGHLQYSVANGTRQVDLGLPELKEAVKGSEFGAEIKAIKESWKKDGSQEIHVKLNLRPESIKSVWLIVDGNKITLEQSGYSGGNDSFTFTFSAKQNLAIKGRLVLEIFDRVQNFETPFKLENITLLGSHAI